MNRAACPVRRLLRAQHTGKSVPDRVRMSSEPEANLPLRLVFTSQAVAMPHRRFPCNYVVDRRGVLRSLFNARTPAGLPPAGVLVTSCAALLAWATSP